MKTTSKYEYCPWSPIHESPKVVSHISKHLSHLRAHVLLCALAYAYEHEHMIQTWVIVFLSCVCDLKFVGSHQPICSCTTFLHRLWGALMTVSYLSKLRLWLLCAASSRRLRMLTPSSTSCRNCSAASSGSWTRLVFLDSGLSNMRERSVLLQSGSPVTGRSLTPSSSKQLVVTGRFSECAYFGNLRHSWQTSDIGNTTQAH